LFCHSAPDCSAIVSLSHLSLRLSHLQPPRGSHPFAYSHAHLNCYA
jgi:hypothetical protein